MSQQQFFRIGEIARMVDLSTATLRLWEQRGKIKPARTESGHRIFTQTDLNRIKELRGVS
jgi:DNA-binding transcriptional MerR regulator